MVCKVVTLYITAFLNTSQTMLGRRRIYSVCAIITRASTVPSATDVCVESVSSSGQTREQRKASMIHTMATHRHQAGNQVEAPATAENMCSVSPPPPPHYPLPHQAVFLGQHRDGSATTSEKWNGKPRLAYMCQCSTFTIRKILHTAVLDMLESKEMTEQIY